VRERNIRDTIPSRRKKHKTKPCNSSRRGKTKRSGGTIEKLFKRGHCHANRWSKNREKGDAGFSSRSRDLGRGKDVSKKRGRALLGSVRKKNLEFYTPKKSGSMKRIFHQEDEGTSIKIREKKRT